MTLDMGDDVVGQLLADVDMVGRQVGHALKEQDALAGAGCDRHRQPLRQAEVGRRRTVEDRVRHQRHEVVV